MFPVIRRNSTTQLAEFLLGAPFFGFVHKQHKLGHRKPQQQGHAPTNHVSAGNYEQAYTKTGGWAYVNDPSDPRFGDVFVNVDKTDSYGTHWTHH